MWWLTSHQKLNRRERKKKEVKMEREQGKSERTRKMGRSQGEAQGRTGREGVLANIFDKRQSKVELCEYEV